MSESEFLDIVVLAGGISHERDVSMRSGRRVADELTGLGHTVTVLDPQAGLLTELATPPARRHLARAARRDRRRWRPALAARDHRDPTRGPRGTAAGLAWSKPTAKELVRRAGYATPAWIALSRETFRDLGAASVLEHLVTRARHAAGRQARPGRLRPGCDHRRDRRGPPPRHGGCLHLRRDRTRRDEDRGHRARGHGHRHRRRPRGPPRGGDRARQWRVQLRSPLQRRRDPVLHARAHRSGRRASAWRRPPWPSTACSGWPSSPAST